MVDCLLELIDGQPPPPSMAEAQAHALLARQPGERASFSEICEAIVTNENTRKLIRKNATLATIYNILRSSPRFRPRRQQGKFIGALQGSSFESKFCRHQFRKIVPSSERAQNVLDYSPAISFRQSMTMFRDWHIQTHGYADAH